jgi:nucleoside-triphosphatase
MFMQAYCPKVLLTGSPGAGKTTVVIQLAALLGRKAAGFFTVELREKGRRVGFEAVTMQGRREILAHIGFPGPYRVGKYGVNPAALIPALNEIESVLNGREPKCLLIDEIGKMELLVPGFKELMTRVFEHRFPLAATVPIKPLPFSDELKKRGDISLVRVTTANRENLPMEIFRKLTRSGQPV